MGKLAIYIVAAIVVAYYDGECVATAYDVPCDQITVCPLIYGPLCGSDGVTYPNDCFMAAQTCGRDVTVVHNGVCVATTTAAAL